MDAAQPALSVPARRDREELEQDDEGDGDGDVVVLKQQETCENGETVAVWLKDQRETTLKKFYLEGDRVRLQPANSTMEPIFTPAENVAVQGRLVTVLRAM